ncbi:diadenosine tetraphosphate (Ap4A) hydrolase [gamma proteobacterium HTCC5015]|nr:diadenosine tetraphosphate (Ap4A) hydrolase [gamma proteobacterium HTCC5015]
MFSLHPQLAKDSRVVGDFPLCRLLLIRDQQYPWFVLVPRREGIRELYELSFEDQQQYFAESLNVSRELMRVFRGEKLNVAALGNMVPQLHIHHIIRYSNDAAWPGPVWGAVPMRDYDKASLDALIERVSQCDFVDFQASPTLSA